MKHDLQSKLTSLESLIKIQTDCLERGYMHGMLNGLICAHSVFTGDRPNYATKLHSKTKVRHKKVKKI